LSSSQIVIPRKRARSSTPCLSGWLTVQRDEDTVNRRAMAFAWTDTRTI